MPGRHESVQRWLAERAAGSSFADVGGLWGTLGEQVTSAHGAGAVDLTMIDVSPLSDPAWAAFVDHVKSRGINPALVRLVCADVESDDFAARVGRHDLVHCNGLLYHTPSPWRFLGNLRKIVGSRLVLGSVVLVDELRSDLPCSLFVPALDEPQRGRVAAAYRFPEHALATGITSPASRWVDGENNREVEPFWWLHPPETIRQLLMLSGFVVDEEVREWDGRCVFFFCRTTG